MWLTKVTVLAPMAVLVAAVGIFLAVPAVHSLERGGPTPVLAPPPVLTVASAASEAPAAEKTSAPAASPSSATATSSTAPAATSSPAKAAPAKAPATAPSAAITITPTTTAAPAKAAPPAAAPAAEKPPIDAAKALEQAIERAADSVGPSVVNILITRESSGPLGLDDSSGPLPDDLKDFLDRNRAKGGRAPFRTQGNGSGVIISSDGYILTSEHVVRDATDIEVTLATRRHFRAKVVGADPRRDLAVIRIDTAGIPAARLGDASNLRRGQFALALGSPFGFGRDGQASISFGIISGLGRAIPGIGREIDRYYGNLIQTDAAVNPGNSGGPLINLDGEVIGVNAVISSQTGASDGVGFAVPITPATKSLIDRLKKGEQIAYGFLGVEIQEVGDAEARASGADVGQGAFVAKVLPDAPGAKAGLREGDVVVSVGDQAVRGPDDVIQIIQATPVGDKVPVSVIRKGKRVPFTVEVARRPPPQQTAAARETGDWWRGMRMEPLTADLREQIGLAEADRGIFVREVRDGSAAAQAGIIPGMVVDQVGEKNVTSVAEFKDAVAPASGPCSLHVFGVGTKVVPLTWTGAPPPAAKTEPRP